MSDSPPIAVTRFAPSPTGHLHIGGARTALFNWALARRLGGHFLLRIEDTDQLRDTGRESVLGILNGLSWLGIDWDEGPSPDLEADRDPRNVAPFYQSQRLDLYTERLNQLLEADLAYHAFETPEELTAMREEAKREKRAFKYDGRALNIPRQERFDRAASGEACVVRFRAPNEEIVVPDDVLGDVHIAPGELDDFVIRKADGFPTYHFAVVVDDELMGVTHVVRGQEHLANTPRHVALQKALGFRTPRYAHLPLIVNPGGGKMSKRDKDKAVRKACRENNITEPPAGSCDPAEFAAWIKDKNRQLNQRDLASLAVALNVELPEIDVEDFRAAGYLPEVVANYIALLGWSPGDDIEKFDMAFLAERFDTSRIGKTGARFDYKKLAAFNNDAVAELSDESFAERWWSWCTEFAPDLLSSLDAGAAINDRFRMLAAATKPRCKTFRDGAVGSAFLLLSTNDIAYDEKAVAKVLMKNDGEGLDTLRTFASELESISTWTPEAIHELVGSFATQNEIGMGKIAQPLRVAITGSTVSPPIDATLAVLGKNETLARIARCLDTHGAAA